MLRSLVLLFSLAAASTVAGQWCVTVVQGSHYLPVVGCAVQCSDGIGAWETDASGRVCPHFPCDSIILGKTGFVSRTVALSDLEKNGTVQLQWAISELPPVEVEHWPRKNDRRALAAASTSDSTLLSGFERSSLRSAAQWIPGVQWDERGHGGSARLSIRGSLLRSPYGVRGVKVYWGPFPLTLADGSTPLEVLDPMLLGSVDIVRSVGSPAFGSAPSGLLLGKAPFRTADGEDLTLEATGGSYGYYRLGTTARTRSANSSLSVGLLHQRNDGYRQQEWSARDQGFITSQLRHERGSTQVFFTWQQASWALPGSVDAMTARSRPRSARPYSVLLDAHVDKEQLMGGMANEWSISEALRLRSAVHGQMIDKTNPYGTSAANCGYKEETVRAAGVRLSLGGDRLFSLPTAWDLGLEALKERDHLRERDFVDAVLGDVKINGDTRVANLNAFLTTVTRLGRGTALHAGLGMERTSYQHEDHVAGTINDRATTPHLMPYAGVERTLNGGYALHLRYAESVSRATVWELLGTEGTFNTDLRGERVQEWEFGVSNTQTENPITADYHLFHRVVDDVIVQVPGTDEVTRYANMDRALIMGFELLVNGRVLDAGVRQMDLLASCAITATDLREFSPTNGERSLGDIPGIPVVTAGLIARTRNIGWKGLGIEAGIRLTGSMETGGAATPDSHVEHARISWDLRPRSFRLSVFLHCENLLDTRYSTWIQANDPGQRYYNPAPGRGFFLGARLTFGSSPPPPTD